MANELIWQLGEGALSELGESIDDDDDEMSDDSPDKKLQASGTKSDLQKWEKNVRRRVYDALNVLYAAGVLKKDGKNVSCDDSVIEMTKEIKREFADSKVSSVASSAEKSVKPNAYEI